ncbi:hypothetical protein HanXRQr2_Chr16g0768061 [Helianthus annuus]|uniref:Uncharacterized protein n=1 Tax=Helianthus annuus TaxID=4232 RepID=A0A9K3GZN0_HELAN|nr:hypothetical protein HanXRQr2_Chr16g0768061 [Helianthus annuus]KAJ0822792.1 hypothetical protein HanPSC8_Chr16g0736221 [Helianthus annuus]
MEIFIGVLAKIKYLFETLVMNIAFYNLFRSFQHHECIFFFFASNHINDIENITVMTNHIRESIGKRIKLYLILEKPPGMMAQHLIQIQT